MILDRINGTGDIKNIEEEQLGTLASEIREFLIDKVSKTGGHLGANLGVVELTMALHLELDLPKDKIIWDVGHQAYTHKILTGRKEGFDNLRKYGGMSGFPKANESDCDTFDTGHSSTSISAGLGMVCARDLRGGDETIVSVIGDGSLTGGLAFEALNNAGRTDSNFIIILNDNNMSISENVGGIPKYLNSIRTSNGYLGLKESVYKSIIDKPYGAELVGKIRRAKNSFKSLMVPAGMLFEEMGIVYLGPVDGHNIKAMRNAIREARRFKRCVLIHVLTKKGKGFAPAEKHPARFHGTEPFDITNGVPLHPRTVAGWTDIFSTVMCKLGEKDEKIVAITAAMAEGCGLKRFRNKYPERFFDVGIAEQHAVTFAAGLAKGGYKPVVAVYSSFLQRAYDQVIEDVCLQNLHVVFAIDRAGLVGADGETHQGVFDLSYLSQMPGMTVCSPKNKWELSDMLKFAVACDGPVAVRYPRGCAYTGLQEYREPVTLGKSEWIYKEDGVCIIALGGMMENAEKAREILKEEGTHVSLVNARFVKPLDKDMIIECARTHSLIVTIEDNALIGGFGSQVLECLASEGIEKEVLCLGIPDRFIHQGSVDKLREELGLDPEGIAGSIRSKLSMGL
ncbi:MAG: 1-deoxy-D-xylulose-5-phosphate synthase [Lachnospiraceae bacterium]|nr:1-deoxy-D-xylulose-5-phosphate synthase [Lachnospiraceae bacterium]MBP5700823.1 1-deoxy-D-xylulose-5-phosphate synthase [Lachnospiraceae bacterium]